MTGRWADGWLWGRRTGEKGLWLRREGWMRAPCGGRSWNWIVGGGHAQLHTWEGCRAAAEAEGLTAGSLFLCSMLPVGEAGVRLTVNLWLFQCEEFLTREVQEQPQRFGRSGFEPRCQSTCVSKKRVSTAQPGPEALQRETEAREGQGFSQGHTAAEGGSGRPEGMATGCEDLGSSCCRLGPNQAVFALFRV